MKLKISLLLVLVSFLIFTESSINKSDGIDKKTKINKKYNQIRQEQIKNGTYSYFKGGTLFVIDKNHKEITRIKLYETDTITYTYKTKNKEIRDAVVWDTLLFVQQVQNKKYLFVNLSFFDSPECEYFGLIDLKTKKLVLNQKSKELSDTGNVAGESFFPFINFPRISKDDKYFLFVSGMGIGFIGFEIYNNNKLVTKGSYYAFSYTENEGYFRWMDNDTFYYWGECRDSIPKNLPKPKGEYDFYVQKIYWVNGKDSLTKEFRIGTGQ